MLVFRNIYNGRLHRVAKTEETYYLHQYHFSNVNYILQIHITTRLILEYAFPLYNIFTCIFALYIYPSSFNAAKSKFNIYSKFTRLFYLLNFSIENKSFSFLLISLERKKHFLKKNALNKHLTIF